MLALLLLAATGLSLPSFLPGNKSYAWLHTALETFSICVAGLVFAIGWSAPKNRVPRIVALLSCAFLGIAVLDFSHAMTFPGMPGYSNAGDVQVSIVFWLGARTLGALALLSAAILPWANAPFKPKYSLVALVLVGVAMFHFVVFGVAPQLNSLFHTELGLTPVKKAYEYALMVIYMAAAVLFARHLGKARHFNASSFMAAAAVMAMSEYSFTLYEQPNDIYNLIGHVYKVIAYIFLYYALFVETIQAPTWSSEHHASNWPARCAAKTSRLKRCTNYH
jgi:hypothetical protein